MRLNYACDNGMLSSVRSWQGPPTLLPAARSPVNASAPWPPAAWRRCAGGAHIDFPPPALRFPLSAFRPSRCFLRACALRPSPSKSWLHDVRYCSCCPSFRLSRPPSELHISSPTNPPFRTRFSPKQQPINRFPPFHLTNTASADQDTAAMPMPDKTTQAEAKAGALQYVRAWGGNQANDGPGPLPP